MNGKEYGYQISPVNGEINLVRIVDLNPDPCGDLVATCQFSPYYGWELPEKWEYYDRIEHDLSKAILKGAKLGNPYSVLEVFAYLDMQRIWFDKN